MPPKRRESRRRVYELTPRKEEELLFGPAWRTTHNGEEFRSEFASERDRRHAWAMLGARLTELAATFCPRMPLQRPWGWWRYESTPVRLEWLAAEYPDFHRRLLAADERIQFAGG